MPGYTLHYQAHPIPEKGREEMREKPDDIDEMLQRLFPEMPVAAWQKALLRRMREFPEQRIVLFSTPIHRSHYVFRSPQ